jgi:chorismate synthase
MAGNSFGQAFRITTFGESHGGAVGVVVDGCPPGLALSEADIQPDLDRRKPGQSSITTPRKEEDRISIQSGVFEGKTTGTPILILAHNKDQRSGDYDTLRELYRPSHADYTYIAKYGLRDWRGSGRASARETLARVAAGAIARKYLAEKFGISCLAYVQQVGALRSAIEYQTVTREMIEANIVRCPDAALAPKMIALIEEVRDAQDSIGGVLCAVLRGVPAGLGEPVFDKLHAELGKAMLSINAVKGFEIGSGFACAEMRGSQHNDALYCDASGRVRTRSNFAGGIVGGISNGEDIVLRVAFKPVATIGKEQQTLDLKLTPRSLQASGRHDPCVLPRAVPMVEAMALLVVMDHVMRQRAQVGG